MAPKRPPKGSRGRKAVRPPTKMVAPPLAQTQYDLWNSLTSPSAHARSIVDRITGPSCGLECKFQCGETPLMLAVQANRLDVVQLLLSNHVEVNVEVVDNAQRSSLYYAAGLDLELVRCLVEEGRCAVRSQEGCIMTPIENALHCGKTAIALYLLEKGGIPVGALHTACEMANLNVVKYLVGKGCDMNEVVNARAIKTPLHAALKGSRCELVLYLLQQGANPDPVGVYNRKPFHPACKMTPLHVACDKGLMEVVNMLVAVGADLSAVATNGLTSLQWVSLGAGDEEQEVKIIQLLRAHGAMR